MFPIQTLRRLNAEHLLSNPVGDQDGLSVVPTRQPRSLYRNHLRRACPSMPFQYADAECEIRLAVRLLLMVGAVMSKSKSLTGLRD